MKSKKVKDLMAVSLSDSDVLNLVENRAKILVYSDLQKYSTIDEALGEHLACFLLYESQHNYGHWVAIYRNDDKVYFFDPYGFFIDDQLEWISTNFREISGQMYPLLTLLLYESPYEIHYNEHKYQKKSAGINTCGRWSALRLVFRDFSPEQFKQLFKGANADEIVTILTSPDLGYGA